jgi:Reverse transcriptase (RNA-dependent DNA polymerase)
VGDAYLESYTKEKVCVIAGPEFGELEGCLLIIDKALYVLRPSGLRWHERFADTLHDMRFNQCKAYPDVWTHARSDHYEYIAVYVDDLAIVAKDPKSITDTLTNKYKYKLKDVGPIDYHLGGNFACDQDGTLRYGPQKYINKLIDAYTAMYGEPPKQYTSPLEKGDHPETDDSPELDAADIKVYQSMMGALQWCVSLGHFDIMAAVMTMSRYRIAPRVGHLNRLKRVYGYLRKFKHGAIRFRTGMPDYSELEEVQCDWDYSIYTDNMDGDNNDYKPTDLPPALGGTVITTTYVDTNLLHCLVTGRSSTGILYLVNGTPFNWYSKCQSTVETATYGSEFVAARIATDQVTDMQLTLAYLGIAVQRSVMFGDNQSVVTKLHTAAVQAQQAACCTGIPLSERGNLQTST